MTEVTIIGINLITLVVFLFLLWFIMPSTEKIEKKLDKIIELLNSKKVEK